MNVPVEKVLNARGKLIVGGDTFNSYLLYLAGNHKAARDRLIREHYEWYFGPVRNTTSDKIVAEIYAERGLEKPASYKESEPEIVMQAVVRRVTWYLEQLEDFRDHGFSTKEKIRMRQVGDQFQMISCGENKVAAWAALGHKTVPDVKVSG
jgi:hypothetical protein